MSLPATSKPIPKTVSGAGEELFLYADSALLRTGSLWDGLARSSLPVRVYAQGASAAQQAELLAGGERERDIGQDRGQLTRDQGRRIVVESV